MLNQIKQECNSSRTTMNKALSLNKAHKADTLLDPQQVISCFSPLTFVSRKYQFLLVAKTG